MDILINGRFLTKSPAGVDRTAQELIRAIAALETGRAIHCAVPANAPPDKEIRERLLLGEGSRIVRSGQTGYAFEQLALARIMPDAILLSLCNMGPVLRARQMAMLHDAQVFDSPQSYRAVFRTAYRVLQPLLAWRAARTLTVSAFSRERLKANRVTGRHDALVIHNGVDHFDRVTADPSVLDRLGTAAGGYALAFAHPAAHKNLAVLLAAYAADGTLPPLVLAGASTAIAAEDDERIIRLGRVSDGELKALYQNALMFLFPSLTEGFGFPALEAMACGCPVVAAEAGAIPEVVGQAAVLLDPSDHLAWASEIAALAAHGPARARLANEGLAQAKKFRWHDSANRLAAAIDAYETELARKQKA